MNSQSTSSKNTPDPHRPCDHCGFPLSTTREKEHRTNRGGTFCHFTCENEYMILKFTPEPLWVTDVKEFSGSLEGESLPRSSLSSTLS